MANKIQIKRSPSTAAPGSLNAGELAFSNVAGGSGVLFIGSTDGGTVVPIGGLRVPGTLTANQALVANASSQLDKVWAANVAAIDNVFVGANVIANTSAYFVGNSSINTFITSSLLDLGGQINANGGVGTAGQILTSGATGNVYWSTPASGVAGSNSQIMFNANGVLSGDAGFTIDGVTDTVTIGGAAQTTSPRLTISNTTTSANLTSNQLSIGANVSLSTSTLFIGNTTINSTATSSLVQVANSTATANLTATQLNVGANASLSTSTLFIGNTTVNASHTATLLQVANSTATSNLTATQLNVGANASLSTSTLLIGNATINATHTSTVLQVANSTATSNLTATQLNVGANVNLSTSQLFVGNSTVNTFLTQNLLDLGGQINANGGVGSAGQVLTSGATGNVYWTTPTDTNTLYDLLAVANTQANQGILRLDPSSADANDDVFFVGANGIVVSSNSTAVLITGQIDTNTTYDLLPITDAVKGVIRLDPSDASANDDINFFGANGIIVTSNTLGVYISTNSGGDGTFDDLTVAGNLTVSGTLTTLDVDTLTVEDPLIELSRTQANTATFLDAVDIGFYGQYGNTANVVYTGLFRDASATDKTFRLFSGQIPAPTTTVDTANVNFGYANLTIHSLLGGNGSSIIDGFALDGGTF